MSEKPRVNILLATIPVRRLSVTRLLNEFVMQTRHPDGIVLVLDGYGDQPAPFSPFPVVHEHRTAQLSGAGNRWRVLKELPPEDIIINIDDDTMLAKCPELVRNLAFMVEARDCAAAIMGQDTAGKMAFAGMNVQRGDIICAAACGLAMKVKHLEGIEEFAERVRAAGGPDCLGVLGDDEALVSAFLWSKRIPIAHVLTGAITSAPGTRESSQTVARLARKENFDVQRQLIRKFTGWPWREAKIPSMMHQTVDPRAAHRAQQGTPSAPNTMLRAATTHMPAPRIANTMSHARTPVQMTPPQQTTPASPMQNTLPRPSRVRMPAQQVPLQTHDASPLTRNTMPRPQTRR